MDSIKPLRPENKRLEEALRKRAEYLANNPHMVKTQEEIEMVLAKAGKSLTNRQAALIKYFRELATDLTDTTKSIQELIDRL